MTEETRIRRELAKLDKVDTSKLDDYEAQHHQIRKVGLTTTLHFMKKSKPEPEPRKMMNDVLNVGDLSKIFR